MRRLLSLALLLAICLEAGAQLNVTTLRTSGLENPQGIDPAGVNLSWILETNKRATFQQAYELTLKNGGRTVWRSGKVESDNSVRVPVGVPLEYASPYTWTVRVWDNHGQVSKPVNASFSTALSPDAWKASWIGTDTGDRKICPSPVYFRKTFRPSGNIKRAVAYVTSRGIYEFSINGSRVGADYFTPGWTTYQKTIQYQAYDVTAPLKRGTSLIEALVCPGWYGSGMGWGAPKDRQRYGSDLALLMQIEIEYAGGRKETLVTGPDWQMSRKGPVADATFYDGETIDLTAAYSWEPATVLPSTAASLVPSIAEPVRIRQVINPVRSFVTPKGEKVLDFGQNLVGWEKVRIKGRKGQVVKVSHAEVLDKEGNFYTKNMRAAKVTSTFVLSGGTDVFEPSQTFYGFRYLKVDGLEGELNPSDFCAVVADSGFETVGRFESSNPLINQLQSNIFWGFRGIQRQCRQFLPQVAEVAPGRAERARRHTGGNPRHLLRHQCGPCLRLGRLCDHSSLAALHGLRRRDCIARPVPIHESVGGFHAALFRRLSAEHPEPAFRRLAVLESGQRPFGPFRRHIQSPLRPVLHGRFRGDRGQIRRHSWI